MSNKKEIVSASPKVRKLAREFGANIYEIKGSERKGRVSEDDVKLFIKDSEVGFVKIKGANKSESAVSTNKDILVTVAKSKKNAIDYKIIPNNTVAPVKSGDTVAQLEVNIPKEKPVYFDLISINDVKQTNLFMRFINMIYNFILSLFV